jgi:iron(III) transport system substrate-binding protein
VAKSPHPAAARLFEDWMVSKIGQQAVVDITNHTSTRPDVTNDTAVWDVTKWKPAWTSTDEDAAKFNSELAELKEALHAP